MYFSKAFYADFETAKSALMKMGEDISEAEADNGYVVGAVYEHTLGEWDSGKKVFELTCTEEYDEEKDEYLWKREATKGTLQKIHNEAA